MQSSKPTNPTLGVGVCSVCRATGQLHRYVRRYRLANGKRHTVREFECDACRDFRLSYNAEVLAPEVHGDE